MTNLPTISGTTLRIGVDGRNLSGNTDGIGRYVHDAIKALGSSEADIFLYSPEKISGAYDVPLGVSSRTANFKGPYARTFWGQMVLPKWVSRDRLDVFWGPAHRMPRVLNRQVARVLTIHDLVWMHAAETMRTRTWLGDRLMMKPALKSADIIVTDSDATAKALAEAFPWLRARVTTVYPGTTNLPTPDGFEKLAQMGVVKPYALFVGTLEPRKNLRNLIKAYQLLPESVREKCDLVIAGGAGWKETDLVDEIRHRGLESYVKLTGFVDDRTLATLYANCEFLAMPSLYEGFGFPIIEAQSFGKAVLTSSTSSMPEVAGSGAVLIDPNEQEAIARAFERLCTEPDFRDRIAAEARDNAARFSWEKYAREMLEVFGMAIEQRRKANA